MAKVAKKKATKVPSKQKVTAKKKKPSPAKGKAARAKRQAPPAKRKLTPAKKKAAPARKKPAPAKRKVTPAKKKAAPARKKPAPAKRKVSPATRKPAPAKKKLAPKDAAPRVALPKRPPPSRPEGPANVGRKRASNRKDGASAFLPDPSSTGHRRVKDDFAEGLGEEFVETITSGESVDDERDETLPEESGGPFVTSPAVREFGHGTDESNPEDAEREPFPTTRSERH
jgi:hypothetical protein